MFPPPLCVLKAVQICMCVYTESIGQYQVPFSRKQLLFYEISLSFGHGSQWVRQSGCPVNPRGPPVSTFLRLGLQSVIMLDFCVLFLGDKLGYYTNNSSDPELLPSFLRTEKLSMQTTCVTEIIVH